MISSPKMWLSRHGVTQFELLCKTVTSAIKNVTGTNELPPPLVFKTPGHDLWFVTACSILLSEVKSNFAL